MLDSLIADGAWALFAATYGSLLVVAAVEVALERRPPGHPLGRRWTSNVALGFVDGAFARWLVPLGAFAAALWCAEHGVGLLHVASAPTGVAVVATLVALDLGAYLAHRLDHRVPLLWRLHRVHHADLDLDFSTAQRHHPLAVLSVGAIQLATAIALGAHAGGVVVYALARGVADAFTHGNLALPAGVDRALRWLVVTPDMHAVHHSAARSETDANFTTLFSVWDRLFGSYREAPAEGVHGMTVGLESFRTPRDLDLDRLLLQPFRREGPGAQLRG